MIFKSGFFPLFTVRDETVTINPSLKIPALRKSAKASGCCHSGAAILPNPQIPKTLKPQKQRIHLVMKLSKPKALFLASMAGLALAASVPTASAALDTTYNASDLILGFRMGGTNQGSDTTIMVNLGAASLYRDATSNLINIANIGALLSPVYGASWYDSTSLFMGIVGANNGIFSDNTGSVAVGQDPNSTIYISTRRSNPAGNPVQPNGLDGSVQPSAGLIVSLGNVFAANDPNSDGIVSISSSTTNGWNTITTGSTGFDLDGLINIERAFGAGSFTFGGETVENILDLYRVPEFVGGNAPGTDGVGTFLGTFTIDSTGNISFLSVNAVPEPSSAALMVMGLAAVAALRRRNASVNS